MSNPVTNLYCLATSYSMSDLVPHSVNKFSPSITDYFTTEGLASINQFLYLIVSDLNEPSYNSFKNTLNEISVSLYKEFKDIFKGSLKDLINIKAENFINHVIPQFPITNEFSMIMQLACKLNESFPNYPKNSLNISDNSAEPKHREDCANRLIQLHFTLDNDDFINLYKKNYDQVSLKIIKHYIDQLAQKTFKDPTFESRLADALVLDECSIVEENNEEDFYIDRCLSLLEMRKTIHKKDNIKTNLLTIFIDKIVDTLINRSVDRTETIKVPLKKISEEKIIHKKISENHQKNLLIDLGNMLKYENLESIETDKLNQFYTYMLLHPKLYNSSIFIKILAEKIRRNQNLAFYTLYPILSCLKYYNTKNSLAIVKQLSEKIGEKGMKELLPQRYFSRWIIDATSYFRC